MKRILFLISMVITGCAGLCQNYHAVQGSSYAGVLGVANNPASIVNAPYPWDVNLLSLQYKSSTNAVAILKYSLLSSPAKSEYRVESGDYSRYANINFNLHLLNARIAINRQHAVAFGMNIRGYGGVKTGKYNFIDTLQNLTDYLKINLQNPTQNGSVTTSGWLELFGTYSGTVWDREGGRLNLGATIKLNRGISGAFAGLQNAVADVSFRNGRLIYLVKSASINYGYSAGIDSLGNNQSLKQSLRQLYNQSHKSISLDVGFEYMKKSEAISGFYDDDNYNGYIWKLGVAVLDAGSNQYQYSSESRSVDNPKENITADMLQNKFTSIGGAEDFNDSLATIASRLKILTGKFAIINPARLVINYDRPLYNNFFINGEVSVNLAYLAGQEKLSVSEFNLFTVTPRWETRRFGAYLPVQYNREGQFWIGGAFKAGPLLIGVHNWGNVLAKNKMHNGGGYVALVIRPGKYTRGARDKRVNCPAY